MIKIMNEKDYPVFITTDPPKYKSNRRKIKYTEMNMISLDQMYEELNEAGETFLITNPEPLLMDGRRHISGIFSPLFGRDMMNADPQSFTCECNYMIGAINLDKECPMCGVKVQFIEPDLRKVAFIDIAPFHVLTYHGINAFSKIFKKINEVFYKNKKINLKGNIIDDGEATLLDLYNDYEEKYEDIIGLPKDIVFTSKIPVFSSVLRPLIRKGVKMSPLPVNKAYQAITLLASDLRDISHIKSYIQSLKILNQIQLEFLNVMDHIKTQTKEKSGLFRRYGVTGRVDYSARLVIRSGTDLKPYEVDIPYQAFMVMYEEEIINTLSKLEDLTVAEAMSYYLKHVNNKDEKMMKVINVLIKKGIWTLINRNPTISESGILYMKIRKINDNINDMTMAIPPDVLELLAADFDGDQLNYYTIKNPRYHDIFKYTFQPTYMFIDRATGYFNKAMGLKRDYSAIISQLWDIGKRIENFVENPNEFTNSRLYDIDIDTLETNDLTEEDFKYLAKLMQPLNK